MGIKGLEKESQDRAMFGVVDLVWPRALALNLAQDLSRDGWVKVDGVVSQALWGLVALATATLEGFPYTDLCAVAILGVVLDAVHILRRGRGDTLGKGRRVASTPFTRKHVWHVILTTHSQLDHLLSQVCNYSTLHIPVDFSPVIT